MSSRISVLLVALILASACIRIKDSPAPGCVEYIGPAPMGGCFGKSVIKDLRIEPQTPCLRLKVNNCNGGVLEAENTCDDTAYIGGHEFRPSSRFAFEIVRDENGGFSAAPARGNFASYKPAQDESLRVGGVIGNTSITISYTKTKELC